MPGSLSVGVDTGGTFTDLVWVDSEGRLHVSKRPSTPGDFAQGVLDVLDAAGFTTGMDQVGHFCHGTTVATNAMITGSGARVGLLTTVGHRDVLPMMRVIGRSAGKGEIELKQYSLSQKPAPIVPKSSIREVHERMAFRGRVVVPLDEDQALEAARELLERENVESLAVCFLWSFMNPAHEEQVAAALKREFPQVHLSISSEIAPAINEYERTATTVVNAHVAPVLRDYLSRLERELVARGLRSPLYIMQSMGGVMRAGDVDGRAANTLQSGPAGGVVASKFLGDHLDHKNIVCADVGGTSFDVGLVVDGLPVTKSTSVVNQYTFLVPTIDIVSIGAGGGSIATAHLGRLQVGPQSAGARPGPACYGKGGTQPTVTDANVALGYIDASYFLGGEISLDRSLSVAAIESHVAEPLGMSLVDAAAGIVEIATHHMADLVRKMTIERGYDPRDFVMYAYGGAGPLHGAAIGREIGVKEVVIPLGPLAAAFSAMGLASSDVMAVAQTSDPYLAPFDCDIVNGHFAELERRALAALGAERSDSSDVEIMRSVELRYRGQVHQVETPVPHRQLTDSDLEAVIEDFEQRYERLYGKGSGFREAGVEVQTFRVVAVARVGLRSLSAAGSAGSVAAAKPDSTEDIFWWDERTTLPTHIRSSLAPGDEISGPAVLRLPTTTVLVHRGQLAQVDDFLNIRITEE